MARQREKERIRSEEISIRRGKEGEHRKASEAKDKTTLMAPLHHLKQRRDSPGGL